METKKVTRKPVIKNNAKEIVVNNTVVSEQPIAIDDENNVTADKQDTVQSETKLCSCCNVQLAVEEFHSDKSTKDGYQTNCKKCKSTKTHQTKSTVDGFMKFLLKDIVGNSKKRNIDVEITLTDIKTLFDKQNGLCYYTNHKMTNVSHARNEDDNQHIINKWNMSVDRKNSKIGYMKDNITIICSIVNRMKMNLKEDDFLLICYGVYCQNKSDGSEKIFSLNSISDKDLVDIEARKYTCPKENIIRSLYATTKDNVNRRHKNLSFEITVNDITDTYNKQNGICKLSGCIMTSYAYNIDNTDNKKIIIHNWNVSIDRIDSNKGYTTDNIQLVSNVINRMKSDMTNEEFIEICNLVTNHNVNKIKEICNKLNVISEPVETNDAKKRIPIKEEKKSLPIKEEKKSLPIKEEKKSLPIMKGGDAKETVCTAEKKCYTCKEILPLTKFHVNKAKTDGLDIICKPCRHDASKHRASGIPGYTTRLICDMRRIKSCKFLLTKEDVLDIYNQQNGKCAVLGIDMEYVSYKEKGTTNNVNNNNMAIVRIDKTKDFTKDNIKLVCIRAKKDA